MIEKHDAFKDKGAAQALAGQLMQNPAGPTKVMLTQVDRFVVNDMTGDPQNPQRVCDLSNGPYYIVSVTG